MSMVVCYALMGLLNSQRERVFANDQLYVFH